ncbi:MAG: hypothetical protein DKINENOH_03627 [bacterium]|nr:hypothetical protein [bacterium]MCK6557797.1 hypothetical protein [bacterium]NUM69048.1 hypothetical protein [candidate division KSB1 bacterium]
MKLFIALMFAAVTASLLPPCNQAEQQREATTANTAAARPPEVLIKFKPAALADSVQAFTAALGLEQVRDLPAIGVRVYRLPAGQSLDQVLEKCRAHPQVEYAEPNLEYRIPEKP